MDRNEARETKRQIAGYVRELLGERIDASSVRPRVPAVGLGLRPLPGGGYGLAERYRLGVPTARMVARKVAEQVGPVADVRRTGRISVVPRRGTGPRPPVVTALATGETGRVRPLRPGVSIAHAKVTAGTLGAFVRIDGALHALSNYHVLVGSRSAAIGDHVLQPGPADGGRDPADRVGTLAGFVPIQHDADQTVDAAVARLDDPHVDLAYPVGPITEIAEVDGTEQVAKVGRTTGLTQGHVTAIPRVT